MIELEHHVRYIAEHRHELELSEDYAQMTNEELVIMSLALAYRNDLLKHCRWVTIAKLIKDGHLAESGEDYIVPSNGAKRGSTNRI